VNKKKLNREQKKVKIVNKKQMRIACQIFVKLSFKIFVKLSFKIKEFENFLPHPTMMGDIFGHLISRFSILKGWQTLLLC